MPLYLAAVSPSASKKCHTAREMATRLLACLSRIVHLWLVAALQLQLL